MVGRQALALLVGVRILLSQQPKEPISALQTLSYASLPPLSCYTSVTRSIRMITFPSGSGQITSFSLTIQLSGKSGRCRAGS